MCLRLKLSGAAWVCSIFVVFVNPVYNAVGMIYADLNCKIVVRACSVPALSSEDNVVLFCVWVVFVISCDSHQNSRNHSNNKVIIKSNNSSM